MSAQSQNAALISTICAVAGVSRLLFFPLPGIFAPPLGGRVGSGRWARSGGCHRVPNHPWRRQNRANCALHAARERSKVGGATLAVTVSNHQLLVCSSPPPGGRLLKVGLALFLQTRKVRESRLSRLLLPSFGRFYFFLWWLLACRSAALDSRLLCSGT